MSTQSKPVFRIPDTLLYWPWPRRMNPHHEEVKAASNAWFRHFKTFRPESQRAFERCDFGLLVSLVFPIAEKEHLRTACDLMNLIFAFDEYTDNAPPELVRQYADAVMDAIRNPFKPRPTDEVVLGVIAQEFWALGVKSASSTSQKYFVTSFELYVDGVVQEAEDRHIGRIRTIEDYFTLRRLNVGVDPLFALIGLEYDLPDEVLHNPTIVTLHSLGRELVILDNDLASYNREQAFQEYPHNIVVCVMNEKKCDLHAAISWVESLHRSTRNKFLMLWTDVPSWGAEIDTIASHYLHGIATWVRGNECWSFESERYFGSNGKVVQQHRMVTLMPKQISASDPYFVLVHQSI